MDSVPELEDLMILQLVINCGGPNQGESEGFAGVLLEFTLQFPILSFSPCAA